MEIVDASDEGDRPNGKIITFQVQDIIFNDIFRIALDSGTFFYSFN